MSSCGEACGIAERESGELDARVGDDDRVEAHGSPGRGAPKREAGGEVLEPIQARSRLEEDVLAGAAGRDAVAVLGAHLSVVAGEAEGDFAAGFVLGRRMLRVVDVEEPSRPHR